MPRPRLSLVQALLALNAAALLLVAVWFRCRSLGNIPGINGDEAWYGLRALDLLSGGQLEWQTPTGNPVNPFFLGPIVLLHACCAPSISLLRFVAVASGVMALAVNWLLCRWVFDRRTALISTVVLAILPINIAYSRFAWDASQSLLATLPVLYFSLAAVRFSKRQGWWIGAALAAEAVALLVHPTNLFAAAAPAAALATRLHWHDVKQTAARFIQGRRAAILLVTVTLVVVFLALGAILWLRSPGPAVIADRLTGGRQLVQPGGMAGFAVLYPRLFTGGTAYRYLAGTHSWVEWPCAEDAQGWGIDVLLFWALLAAAAWLLWRSWQRQGRREDRVLLSASALELAAFLLAAGPPALAPGYERYAICLIGFGVVVLSRGAALCTAGWHGQLVCPCLLHWLTSSQCHPSRHLRRVALLATALCGWLLLADYQAHYFDFIERTGGRAHPTFRTAAVEPKLAALQLVGQQREPGAAWIVTSEYWNELPLRYLAWDQPDLCIVTTEDAESSADFARALTQGRVWFVEFADSPGLQQAQTILGGRRSDQWQIDDYGGRPVLCVLHAAGNFSASGK